MAGASAEALPRDLQERLQAAVRKADNPVGAVRALRREAARLSARYRGQRAALRWCAELALRPYWRDLTGDQAAKACVWAVLDGIWQDGPKKPDRTSAKAARRVTVAVAESLS